MGEVTHRLQCCWCLEFYRAKKLPTKGRFNFCCINCNVQFQKYKRKAMKGLHVRCMFCHKTFSIRAIVGHMESRHPRWLKFYRG